MITGSTLVFATAPSWVAGASDAAQATSNCQGAAFTGGSMQLAQYPSGGFDANLACAPAPPPAAGFSLSVSPSSQTVAQGSGTSYTVTISRTGGFSGVVNLSASGLPGGAGATFSPNPAAGTSSVLVVTTSTKTPRGSRTLTITGSSGSLTRTVAATLVVQRRR